MFGCAVRAAVWAWDATVRVHKHIQTEVHTHIKGRYTWRHTSWTSRRGTVCGLPEQRGENEGNKEGKAVRNWEVQLGWGGGREEQNLPHPLLSDPLHGEGPTKSGPLHGAEEIIHLSSLMFWTLTSQNSSHLPQVLFRWKHFQDFLLLLLLFWRGD